MSTKYELRALPVPPTKSDVDKFSTLRLLALQTDPASFGSTYDREIAFTYDQWRDRLNSRDKGTLIIENSSGSNEWVATATVLAPLTIPYTTLAPLRDIDVWKNSNIFVLVGVWVNPAHRRRGLGKKLVEGVFEWIKEYDGRDSEDGDNGSRNQILALNVHENNAGGQGLYAGMGFYSVSEIKSDHGAWMVRHVI